MIIDFALCVLMACVCFHVELCLLRMRITSVLVTPTLSGGLI